MKFIISVGLMVFGLTLSYAQATFSVQGKVIDFHNKVPLSSAVIKIGNYTVISDAKGNFNFQQIKRGSYTLIANHPDCDAFTQKIDVSGNLNIILNLEHHIGEIETVTIHGNHRNNGSMVMKTLDKAQIEKNATDNLGNLLSKISGVSALKTGNNIAKPIIHGLYGSRISILNNGVRLAEQEWGVEHAPNVDINNFQHIDVVKGASALKYSGDAVGGVVVLEPATFAKKDTLKGSVNLSGISNGKGVGVDIDVLKSWKNGWAVKSSGSMRKLGDQQTADYNLMNTGMDFSSFNFTLQKNSFKSGFSFDYYLTNQNIGIYRGSHIGNTEDFYHAINSAIPVYTGDFSYNIDNPKQVIEHHIAKLSGFKRFENIGKVSATYSFQYNHRQEYDIRRGELSLLPSLDLALMTHQLNVNDFLERERFSLETGIDGSFQNNYSDPATKARRLIPNYDKFGAAIYSVFKYKLTPNLNAEAGARFDYNFYDVTKWYDTIDWYERYATTYPEFYVKTEANRVLTRPQLKYQNFSYNAGVEYHPSGKFNLKLNYAKASRTPNIAELFSDGLHHSAAIIEMGSMNLKNEVSHQFNLIADVKFDVLQGLQLSVNPYFSINKNFINEIPTGVQNTIRGVFPVWSYQQIDAKMYGVDLDVDFKLNNWLSYKGRGSYVYGQDETHGEPLILMMPANFTNALQFSKKSWNGLYLNVENQTFLAQNRFPVHNAEVKFYENGSEVHKTVDFSTPPNGYSLWNVQAGLDVAKNLSAGLIVNNTFNTSYRDYLNRMRFFAADLGRNFILNIRYRF